MQLARKRLMAVVLPIILAIVGSGPIWIKVLLHRANSNFLEEKIRDSEETSELLIKGLNSLDTNEEQARKYLLEHYSRRYPDVDVTDELLDSVITLIKVDHPNLEWFEKVKALLSSNKKGENEQTLLNPYGDGQK